MIYHKSLWLGVGSFPGHMPERGIAPSGEALEDEGAHETGMASICLRPKPPAYTYKTKAT